MIEPQNRHWVDDDALWSQLSESLSARMGVHYPFERRSDLVCGITAAAAAFGMDSVSGCARWLVSAPLSRTQIETLARCLTVGETYFFRDRPAFEALRHEILPGLLDARTRSAGRRLRVWSAGCCSGEEPYSIAILLRQMIPNLHDWDVSILATDIDPDYLRKARLGIYSEWSFRDMPDGVKEHYFKPIGKGLYQVDARIRSMVRFEFLNLAENVYPSAATGTVAMDLVFCRNVLMYFSPACAAETLQRIELCLSDEGWLLVSPVEIALVGSSQLLPVQLPHAIFHHKGGVASGHGSTQAPPLPLHQAMVALVPAMRDETTACAPTQPPVIPTSIATHTAATPSTSTLTDEADQLYQLGHYDDARIRFLSLLMDRPEDTTILSRLAKCHANLGQLNEAAALCEQALMIDKLNTGLCCLLGDIRQQQGDDAQAIRMLRRALYLDPDNALAHFSLGNLIRHRNHGARADHHLRTALALLDRCPSDQVLQGSDGLTAGRLAQILRSTEAQGFQR